MLQLQNAMKTQKPICAWARKKNLGRWKVANTECLPAYIWLEINATLWALQKMVRKIILKIVTLTSGDIFKSLICPLTDKSYKKWVDVTVDTSISHTKVKCKSKQVCLCVCSIQILLYFLEWLILGWEGVIKRQSVQHRASKCTCSLH